MGLSLVAGPANAGKVALLLDRYLARLDDEPYLIVPNRSDVDRVERDLLRRCGCLLGGTIGTFDDLFERLAAPGGAPASDAQRLLVVRRAIARVREQLEGLTRSASSGGFAETLLAAVGELESGLLDPHDLDGELAALYAAYRAELDRVGLRDRDLLRRSAVDRLENELDAWHGEPVFAYGFEDLTAAEWSLLDALAGRTEVHVSLPYEPGRTAFASLRRTAEDLAALASGRLDELAPLARDVPAALAHLERGLFESTSKAPLDGGIQFLEGAGTRATLELVADELLALLRRGVPAEEIGVVVPSVQRWRAPLETVFGTFDIPHAVEGRVRLGSTPFGHALLSLLRFAWADGARRELYAFLRSPHSGIARPSVDYAEGRLRGRVVNRPERVEEETEKLRSAPLVALRDLRDAASPVVGARELVRAMLRNAHGLSSPPVGTAARQDLRCAGAAISLLDELEEWGLLGEPLSTDDIVAALERADVQLAPAAEAGRVAVLDLPRARTRHFRAVFVLGLEEGSLPRRGASSALLDDDRRRELGRRLERPDPVSRDRYLFYTACTRATERLVLVREAATDEGSPREASPFWSEVTALFDEDDVRRATRRRALSQLTWQLDDSPTERERVRALARLTGDGDVDAAVALADANGWTRRLQRARNAFERRTRLRNPALLAELGARRVFSATELERFADCSSAWLFERVIDPKDIDAEPDAMLRGKVAHQALYTFYGGLPKELGTERVDEANLEPALAFLERCLDEALRGGVRLDLTDVQAAELRVGLRHDLERFVREEARSPLQLVPRRFEVGFGSDRSAPELQRGLDLGDGLFASGKIDRIDLDPFSARGIVQDYKSGKGSYSAAQIDAEHRLQVPLYMLVLRDLVGVEPIGGVYRALAGGGSARGMLRTDAREDLPGFKPNDYLDEEAFWAQVESARDRARTNAQRIRRGDVAHDPRGGECPPWCDLWTMCRVARA
ncbi:MAG: PD-(D/E)XK nuclease family protein [Actinobacteria bacterium]|nr:PD-(D/E)XK nuclease family protein [Actinomycetota bacterium]